MFNKSNVPLIVIFLIIGALILVLKDTLSQHGFSWQVLTWGNVFLYIVTLVSMQLLSRGLQADRTQVFLRNAYSGILVKLFACAAAAFVYIMASGNNLNRGSLFGCMGLYLIYTFVEVSAILKQSNAKKHV